LLIKETENLYNRSKRVESFDIDYQQASADRTDLFDTLRALRTIIFREKGNHILVNVSTGSKIQAIASMMACMMFKDMATIKPYYVVPEKYTNLLEDVLLHLLLLDY